MVWSPLAGGLLCGKYDRDEQRRDGQPAHDLRLPAGQTATGPTTCIDAMRASPSDAASRVAQVALAWLLHQPVVTSVIIGAKRPEQLDDNIAATT